jgi:hypothetical protein
MLLENVRFHPGETQGDLHFASLLASLGTCYVNDAFGTAHRAHASTAVIAKFFPNAKCFGYVMAREIANADKVIKHADRPFTAITGGAKVSDKLLILENLIDKVDNLIIGGDLTISSQGIWATNNTAGLTILSGGEGGPSSYNDVEISTNRGEWTFENTGGLRFDDGSRQWTSASAIAEELPYSIDINTDIRRIVAYGTAQAEIDPGIMTPVSLPGSRDDNYITLNTLPFNVTFLNQSYALLGVGSNSYVTFGGGTDNYNFGDDPTMGGANLPAIIISEADNSFQRIFTYATGSVGSQEFSIRYEGTNATGGTPGQSNIIWQLTFYENNANVISLLLIQDARSNDGISGITDGQNWQMETANNRTLPRLPWNQFAPRAIRFADSSISIDANNNATINIAGGGGASTGNIRFDNTWIKNVDTGNIYISPQDGFTYLDLPSDTQASAGNKVTLTNEAATGGVRIRAGQQGKKWDFNYDGSITFPDNKNFTSLGF